MNNLKSETGYSIGHPWHYVLGGKVPTPKRIRALAIKRGYRGYMEANIAAASKRPEPGRSTVLRKIRAIVMDDLRSDLSCYRKLARELHEYRREYPQTSGDYQCNNIHTGISLKFAHIYNGFAHLHYLDSLPQQGDLFDLL